MKFNYRYDCNACPKRCDGRSKKVYNFKSDSDFSEHYEKLLIEEFICNGYYAQKTEKTQYPDVEVYDKKDGELLCYIEVKVQRRTFMSVERHLPYANLIPSETVALNLSDLNHYIEQSKIEDIPIYIMWVLAERPCILKGKEVMRFYNRIEAFEKLLLYYRDKRKFKRASGAGDIINGEHKGVVVNYHFSLNEMFPFNLKDVL